MIRRLLDRDRQPDREGRALAVGALDGQVTAHQPAEMPADGEAQPGAAVLTPGTGFRLGERFEEAAELLLGHADPGVRDGESDEWRVTSGGRRRSDPVRAIR